MTDFAVQVKAVGLRLGELREQMETVIRGKREVIDKVIIALLAGGHVLLEDLPGMGKTTLAYALARCLNGSFQRLQFTSDLLPADVIGVSIYNDQTRQFEFRKGPVFANFVLADEINRTTPKTQSALLEVMDRGRVSIDGETHAVGAPFMVFATQNPVDFEGTFRLPDSQLDRFLVCLDMGYPAFADELDILASPLSHYDALQFDALFDGAEVLQWQALVDNIHCEPAVLEYLLRLVTATRTDTALRTGISPRGAIAIKRCAQAHGLYRGRAFVIPEDIAAVFTAVSAHRVVLARHGSDPMDDKRRIEAMLLHLLETIPLPV